MAYPSAVSTTHLDAGTDTLPQARLDIYNLALAFNDLIAMRGVAGGFPALDNDSQIVAGTSFLIGLVSSNPTFKLSASALLIYNRTSDKLEIWLGGSKTGEIPFATPMSGANLTNGTVALGKIVSIATARLLGRYNSGSGSPEEIGLGTGVLLTGGNLAIDSTFLAGLLQMPACGFAATGNTQQGVNNGNQYANYLYTVLFDTHTAYDGSNKFTCPSGQGGTYFFKFLITGTHNSIQLHKNGSSFASVNGNTVTGTVVLAPGDYVQPYFNNNPISNESSPYTKGFAGYRIA